MFHRGDRVKHATRTDWGLGEVLDDQSGDRVRVVFEDVGVKTFDLRVAQFIEVGGEEARSDYLTALVRFHLAPKRRTAAKEAPMTFPRALETFLKHFPRGFQDPDYLSGPNNEREYKWEAHQLMVELLGRDQMEGLIEAGAYEEICARARRVINKTNLIHYHEKLWLSNGLSSEGRRGLFARELANLLYGAGPPEERFERYTRMLYDIGTAKWPIATYLWFIACPDTQMFLKPEVTKHAANILGVDIGYRPEVNWSTYSKVLRLADTLQCALLKDGRESLKPADLIDVQSFIWVIGPGYSL